MKVITRQQANENGEKYYFTGNVCKKGHTAKRSVSNCVCYECSLEKGKKFRENNPDYHNKYNKSYYVDNKDRCKTYGKRHYIMMAETKKDELLERQRKNSITYINNNKEEKKIRDKLWRQNNKGLMNNMTAKRRARKLNATPMWADLETIKQTYIDCAEINIINKICGGDESFVVDHDIPLQGKIVCGLHLNENLQIILESTNARKGNKLLGE